LLTKLILIVIRPTTYMDVGARATHGNKAEAGIPFP